MLSLIYTIRLTCQLHVAVSLQFQLEHILSPYRQTENGLDEVLAISEALSESVCLNSLDFQSFHFDKNLRSDTSQFYQV